MQCDLLKLFCTTKSKLLLIYFTSACHGSYEPNKPITVEMGKHLTAHGDGVKDIAFAVEDLDAIMERAEKRGVTVVRDIWEEEDEVCIKFEIHFEHTEGTFVPGLGTLARCAWTVELTGSYFIILFSL